MKLFLKVFLLCSLILSSCSESFPTISKTFNKDFLQGKWISLEDKKFELEFNDNKRLEFYSKVKVAEGIFKLQDSNLIVVDDELMDTMKYKIIRLDKDNLTLIYLERGNTQKFKKKK